MLIVVYILYIVVNTVISSLYLFYRKFVLYCIFVNAALKCYITWHFTLRYTFYACHFSVSRHCDGGAYLISPPSTTSVACRCAPWLGWNPELSRFVPRVFSTWLIRPEKEGQTINCQRRHQAQRYRVSLKKII